MMVLIDLDIYAFIDKVHIQAKWRKMKVLIEKMLSFTR
jgi:hypothetical protein